MKFNLPNFETFQSKNEKDPEEKLRVFILEIAEKIKNKDGIILTKDCRIDINDFSDIYPKEEIENDLRYIRKKKQEYEKLEEKTRKNKAFVLSPEEILLYKEKLGEKLELFKTAIFNKFLGENFISIRSSEYDDIKNGVDNIILEKESQDIVCAVDETGDIRGKIYEEKKRKILKKNINSEGVKLKYGLKFEKDGKIVKGKVSHIPIFYLALPKDILKKGVEELIPEFGKFSEYEKKIMQYFISVFFNEIRMLEIEPEIGKMNQEVKERILRFKKVIKEINENIKRIPPFLIYENKLR